MTQDQMAWAAGLFEGEGCFTLHHSRSKNYLEAKLSMTDSDIVVRFYDVIGFGNLTIRKPQRPGWKGQLAWRATSFEHVQQLVCYLWPWLGKRRRIKARELLLACQRGGKG